MKIGAYTWNIPQSGQRLGGVQPSSPSQPAGKIQKTPLLARMGIKQPAPQNTPLKARDVLTEHELATLRALFGAQEKSNHFYGSQKPAAIHTGYLLDVKG